VEPGSKVGQEGQTGGSLEAEQNTSLRKLITERKSMSHLGPLHFYNRFRVSSSDVTVEILAAKRHSKFIACRQPLL